MESDSPRRPDCDGNGVEMRKPWNAAHVGREPTARNAAATNMTTRTRTISDLLEDENMTIPPHEGLRVEIVTTGARIGKAGLGIPLR
jgi:hypothetical protein